MENRGKLPLAKIKNKKRATTKKTKKSFCEERHRKMILFFWFCYLKNTIGRKIKVNNTKFVAILILGTSVLPFCLRWANTACPLWRMFNTGRAKVQRELLKSCDILWAARSTLCAALRLPVHVEHASQCTCCTGPAKTKWQPPVPKNRMSITTNSVFTELQPIKTNVFIGPAFVTLTFHRKYPDDRANL